MPNEYIDTRRIVYGDEGATFVPVCPKCGRFVKADEAVSFAADDSRISMIATVKPRTPNATCVKCGRVGMPFEGFMG